MKLLIFYTTILLVLYGIGAIVKKEKCLYDFFDRTHTTILKGIAIGLVLAMHACAVFGISNVQFVAGCGVGIFLLCSGYGVMISVKENGLHNFALKRFSKVVIPCWGVCVIEYIVKRHETSTLLDVILLRNANWYIRYIVICYMLFGIICYIFKEKEIKMIRSLIIAFVIWYVIESTIFYRETMPFLRARQMAMFPLGVILAMHSEKIEHKMNTLLVNRRGRIKILSCMMAFVVIGCAGQLALQLESIKQMPYLITNVGYLIVNTILSLALLGATIIWKPLFQNMFVKILGVISYELFLLSPYIDQHFQSEVNILVGVVILGIGAMLMHMVDSKIMKVINGKRK